jgi:uncharacterized membrane protein YgaE (UPF0421/DUF939 family)
VATSRFTEHLSTEYPLDDLIERARRRGRRSLRARRKRLQAKSWHIGQAAIAAGLAWFIARHVVGHTAPVFAPIVAVVCLGMSYGQRLRRVAEVTVGVAIGVLVADLFVALAGHGAWQITLVVAVSMSIALLMDAGDLLVMQSAVQSIFVAALAPAPGQTLTRWLDAAIGGAVALLAAAVVPSAPLRRPRVQAAVVAQTAADLLRGTAVAARAEDVQLAATVLGQARSTDYLVRELEAAAEEGMDVIASSPFLRRQTPHVRRVADLIEPLDRALRGTRVLARRIVVATSDRERVPPSYLRVIEDLAAALDVMTHVLTDNGAAEIARPPLLAVAAATGDLERTGQLSTEVILAQVRSIIVDLLQVSGLTVDAAVAVLPSVREPHHDHHDHHHHQDPEA